jgi:hypothetical protein
MSTPLIPLSHLGAGPHPVMKLRFMDKVRRILVEHRYAERTAAAYALWIRRYIIFHGRRIPTISTPRTCGDSWATSPCGSAFRRRRRTRHSPSELRSISLQPNY